MCRIVFLFLVFRSRDLYTDSDVIENCKALPQDQQTYFIFLLCILIIMYLNITQ